MTNHVKSKCHAEMASACETASSITTHFKFVDHWCSLFTDKPSTILKHYPACWLSLLKCVNRYLSQYQGLQSYFLSFEEAETVKLRSI